MLFNSFKRSQKQGAVKEHFGAFQKDFTENQKKAVMASLLTIANADGKFHRKERQFFAETSVVIGYELNEDFIDDFLTLSRDDVFRLLNSLDEGQKDWYILTALGMVYADKKVYEIEMNYLSNFLYQMGIDKTRVDRVLRKAGVLMDKFA